MPETLYASELHSLPLVMRGKVRDIYAVGVDHLLIVATDRLSAFDVVLADPIPGKGAVLTELTHFWFDHFAGTVADQRVNVPPERLLENAEVAQVEGRAMFVRRLDPLPIEAVVRGYVAGSGWRDYQASGAISGIELPPGLAQAEQLAEPIFTPATKAGAGAHDEPLSFAQTAEMIGPERAEQVRALALALYRKAATYAAEHGIIIADTKFEFGLDHNDELVLIDEVLTPDSSRFWPADGYTTGISPPSFDKQYVRDYLDTLDWDKTAPGPHLSDEVIANTAARYAEARARLIGK
jgi:phosphoribosylaminoimidazole-succinocarboxamide synthase